MDDSFELLEQRVQKAAARLRELTAENGALRAEVQAASARADKAERAARTAAPAGAEEELSRARAAVRELSSEREEIRARVAKMLELLERLE